MRGGVVWVFPWLRGFALVSSSVTAFPVQCSLGLPIVNRAKASCAPIGVLLHPLKGTLTSASSQTDSNLSLVMR
jgi:hypothetical protein